MHLVVQAAQPLAQILTHLRIQRTERLVEQQDLRIHRQRTGQRHALTLPTRQLRGVAMLESVESDDAEQFVDPLGDLGFGRLRIFRPNAMLSRTVMCLNAA